MSAKVLQLLEGRIDREKIKIYLEGEVEEFDFLVSHMQKSEKPSSWRAAWVVHHIMKKNDSRLQKDLHQIIKNISDKDDGHQRELLKIVRKMKLSEKDEGYFFDVCVNLWEEVHKKPATRYYAGLFIIEMSKKYPDIKNELKHLTTEYYTQTLSTGIKRIFDRELSKIN